MKCIIFCKQLVHDVYRLSKPWESQMALLEMKSHLEGQFQPRNRQSRSHSIVSEFNFAFHLFHIPC